MRIACWMTKATNTLSQYLIFIAFPLLHCLRERASMLRYIFIACLALSMVLRIATNNTFTRAHSRIYFDIQRKLFTNANW
jgi:hypothetical protein